MKLYERKQRDCAPLGQADPYMIRAQDGRYYLYASGAYLFSSDRLKEDWQYDGVCLDAPGQKSIWAPSVISIQGKYYMYFSSIPQEKDGDHFQTMRVAVSDGPEGPFTYIKDMLPPFSIDPHVVQTPSGLYMFYCNNDEQAQRAGTFVQCDKMTDPYTMSGEPVAVIAPTIDEEIFRRDRFRKGQHWHTIEGAFYFYHAGTHFLMYSGACYQNPTYFIGYSVAHGPEEADLRMLDWKKYPDASTYAPLMCKNSFVEGVGHNSVIREGGRYYVVYHGRDYTDRSDVDTRVARIDEMKIDGDKLGVAITP